MSKNIILFSDGSWQGKRSIHKSNVYIAYSYIKENFPKDIVFHDDGIGHNPIEAFYGGVFGLGLSKNIKLFYNIIVRNYKVKDSIYLLGFSRGAFTMRSLAGLIYRCGIIDFEKYRDNIDEIIDMALSLYKDTALNIDSPQFKRFKEKYSLKEDEIKFLGCLDTVSALGIPKSINIEHNLNRRFSYHDANLNKNIKNAFHALALHEKRADFEPVPFDRISNSFQNIEEKWFLGDHRDIGGGHRNRDLSNITLFWMMEKISTCGLNIDLKWFSKNYKGNPLGKLHNPPYGNEFRKLRRLSNLNIETLFHKSVKIRYDKNSDTYDRLKIIRDKNIKF